MLFRSFIDSESHGAGPTCGRLYFRAECNALEWSGLSIWDDGGREIPQTSLASADMAAIGGVLNSVVAEKRAQHMADCDWLRRTFREAK